MTKTPRFKLKVSIERILYLLLLRHSFEKQRTQTHQVFYWGRPERALSFLEMLNTLPCKTIATLATGWTAIPYLMSSVGPKSTEWEKSLYSLTCQLNLHLPYSLSFTHQFSDSQTSTSITVSLYHSIATFTRVKDLNSSFTPAVAPLFNLTASKRLWKMPSLLIHKWYFWKETWPSKSVSSGFVMDPGFTYKTTPVGPQYFNSFRRYGQKICFMIS